MAFLSGDLKVNSKDPRINYTLVPGEELWTCPYNLSHAVRPIKFTNHVLNCHRLHCKDRKSQGLEPLFSICQYDRSHHVPNQELAYHEAKDCIARLRIEKGEDYGWEEADDAGPTPTTSAASSIPTPVKKEAEEGATGKPEPAPWRKIPEIDPESLAKITDGPEDWDKEPAFEKKFDADKRVDEFRKHGYAIIKAQNVIGLTKSEKKKFYQEDADVLEAISKQNFLNRIKDQHTSTWNRNTSVHVNLAGSGSGASKSQSSSGSSTLTNSANPGTSGGGSSCSSMYGFEFDSDLITTVIREED